MTMNQVIWDMTCWLVSSYWSSETAFCLHFLIINSPTIIYNFEPDADKKIQPAAHPDPRWQSWKTNCQKQWYRRMGTLLKAGTRLYPRAYYTALTPAETEELLAPCDSGTPFGLARAGRGPWISSTKPASSSLPTACFFQDAPSLKNFAVI